MGKNPPMPTDTERARELFFDGVERFERGDVTGAEAAFAAAATLAPERVSILANLGSARLRLGRFEAALEVLERAVALAPGDLDARSHLGAALAGLGRHAEALACHERVLAAEPGRDNDRFRRALSLHALGRHDDALVALEAVLERQPDRAEAWFRHGQALQGLERHDESLASYERALAIEPGLAAAWRNRGGVLRERGDLAGAAEAFRQALASGSAPELDAYLLAAVEGADEQGRPPPPPRAYVESLFDGYADTFDVHVAGTLRYRGHATLVEGLGVAPGRYRHALDLGCGTGLCGPLLRPMAERLGGVDVAAAMLAKARTLGVYDELVHADIAEHLQATQARHDLVVAADVFIYVGDLEATFAGVRRVLDPGGRFCFTAEPGEEGAAGKGGVALTPSLRYTHSPRYLRELAARHGFTVEAMVEAPLREDQRVPVPGLYVYLRADVS